MNTLLIAVLALLSLSLLLEALRLRLRLNACPDKARAGLVSHLHYDYTDHFNEGSERDIHMHRLGYYQGIEDVLARTRIKKIRTGVHHA